MGSLGTVLDRLSGIFSKYFLVESYFPVLVFLGANGIGLYYISPSFRGWIGGTSWKQGLVGVIVLIGAAVLACLLSAMSVSLREWLEDPPMLRGRPLHEALENYFLGQRQELRVQLEDLRLLRRELRRGTWDRQLFEARQAGLKLTTPNSYSERPAAVKARMNALRGDKFPSRDEVKEAVEALAAVLGTNNVEEKDLQDPARLSKSADRLDADEVAFRSYLKQLGDSLENKAVQLHNRLQLDFAGSEVAPTRMGNIALSVQSYFGSRYNLNFNFFLTRIQKTLQSEEKYFPVLATAKAQLDFIIALFWLSCLFAVSWTPVAAWWGFSFWLLLAAAVAAPASAWLFYQLAVRSYRSYADLLRTTVDLFHFQLLQSLHIALPHSSVDERELWRSIGEWLGHGDYRDVSYSHPRFP